MGRRTDVREWLVAGAIIETDDGILLVRNQRRHGATDWTPPGGVIEIDESEDVLDGLAREVVEETGLVVESWGPKLYEVEAEAPGLGWVMRAQIWRVDLTSGELAVGNDPDGIVVEAAYVPLHRCGGHLETTHAWVREPLTEWLDLRWDDPRTYRYRLEDAVVGSPNRGRIVRL